MRLMSVLECLDGVLREKAFVGFALTHFLKVETGKGVDCRRWDRWWDTVLKCSSWRTRKATCRR